MSTEPGAVYVCYFPLSDPLVDSQVLSYLMGLAAAGYRIHLITFELSMEPAEEVATTKRLLQRGIHWSCLHYQQNGSVPRKILEGLRGVFRLSRVVLTNNLRVIHARAHPAALMAYPVARLFGRKLLFDVRGLIADEYADIGRWPRSGLLYRTIKMAERFLLKRADAVVFLTQAVVRDLTARKALSTKDLDRVTVIPCCVAVPGHQPGGGSAAFVLAYVGKLGSWYLEDEIVRFFMAIRAQRGGAKLLVLSQSPPGPLRARLAALGLPDDDATIEAVPHADLGRRLREANAAVAFYKPGYSKVATSPTKVSDCLAAGLPIAINSGIGDCDSILGRGEVGVSLDDFSEGQIRLAAERLIALADTPGIRERCRKVAVGEFDLAKVGVARYRTIYAKLSA